MIINLNTDFEDYMRFKKKSILVFLFSVFCFIDTFSRDRIVESPSSPFRTIFASEADYDRVGEKVIGEALDLYNKGILKMANAKASSFDSEILEGEAIKFFRRSIEIFPSFQAYVNICILFYKLELLENGINYARNFVESFPVSDTAHFYLAGFLFFEAKRIFQRFGIPVHEILKARSFLKEAKKEGDIMLKLAPKDEENKKLADLIRNYSEEEEVFLSVNNYKDFFDDENRSGVAFELSFFFVFLFF